MKSRLKGVDILLFLFIIYSGLPLFSAYLHASANILVIVVMYVYVALKLKSHFLSNLTLILPIFAVELLHCFGNAFWGGEYFFRDFYGILRKMLWPLFTICIVRDNNQNLARNALLLTLLVYSITAITTIVGCQVYPSASRTITDTFQDESIRYFLKSLNIGDFQFVYTVALAMPLIIYLFKYHHLKILSTAFFVVLFTFMIYSAEFTIALVFSTFTLALFFVPKSISVKRLLMISSACFIILILSKSFLIDLLQHVSEKIGSDTMSQRFSDMSESLSGAAVGDESDYSLRTEAWQQSWNSFWSNPVWGTFGKGGGHSLMLDTIGNFGLIGIAALIITFRSLYKLYVCPYMKYDIYLFAAYIYLLNIPFCLFNTLIMYVVFTFFLPLIAFRYSQKLTLVNEKDIISIANLP